MSVVVDECLYVFVTFWVDLFMLLYVMCVSVLVSSNGNTSACVELLSIEVYKWKYLFQWHIEKCFLLHILTSNIQVQTQICEKCSFFSSDPISRSRTKSISS